jgi:hypothetical protein
MNPLSDHIIEWLTPFGSPAPLRGKLSVEDTVSHLAPVRKAVYDKAFRMAMDASAALAFHRRTGSAHINVTPAPPRLLDCWVELRDKDPGGKDRTGKPNVADRSAMSIEFGWTQTHAFGKKLKHPVHHDGLHLMRWAMNSHVRRFKG